ncbi:hypothetical protein ZIOFF_014750 [Zingiber officinale]|uniref:non-specific serine/threonine protein kinase n=1 Tax=Zingiber officinale TaxID=94328 RepID=A0A8J5LVS5_ZINOF|nr:hypothetical protein ZIOFF_014750 [Zingiber officinale]
MLLSPQRFWILRLTAVRRKRVAADACRREEIARVVDSKNFQRGVLASEATSALGFKGVFSPYHKVLCKLTKLVKAPEVVAKIQSSESTGTKEISRQQHNQFREDIPGIESVTIYTYKELKNATNGFSPANKIGEGGFGSVYKGRLRDGKDIAVKVLSSESKQGAREFLTEITVISGIIHDNLVKLYGCCVEGSHRILVYNYLENNSLAQCLLGSNRNNIHFNWRTRVKISVGVARGLTFLHEEVQPHVVHRDIKASNILLDKDLTPKISDFGLAKLLPTNMTHVSTRVAGTIGYLAPEYAIRGQVTRKSDIYSYGVLLLEIVSGRCNTNTRLPYQDQFLLERVSMK